MMLPCIEDGRTIERDVRPLGLEPQEMLAVYDRLKNCTNLFGVKEDAGEHIVEGLIRMGRYIWRVDDVGIIAVLPVGPHAAHVHITFWDKRLRGREGLCRSFARYILASLGLDTLWTGLPGSARATLAFAKRVGFVEQLRVGDRVVMYATDELLHRATSGG